LAKNLIALDEEGDGSGFQIFHDMNNYGIKQKKTDRANEPGEYRNFTGIIDWEGTTAKVKRADFKIEKFGDGIRWKNG
jgi:hypothetical protein